MNDENANLDEYRSMSPWQIQHGEQVGIVLPCDVNRFGEFITGLLGQRQTIDGFEVGSFSIDQQAITNVYHLVSQRIRAQNDYTLAAFSIRVIYNNGNSVTHDTLRAFIEFHPVEPCHPVEVVISLTYLITFKGRYRIPVLLVDN